MPKISCLFFSRLTLFSFILPPAGCLLVEFWWCLKRRDAHLSAFGVLWLSCASPGSPVGPPGFHTTAREPKRAHFGVPAFKNTTKIQREDTQRGKKRTNFPVGEGRKRAKFWVVRRRAVRRSPNPQPQQDRTTQQQQQRRRQQTQQHNNTTATQPPSTKFGQNTKTLKLAKVGLAKVSQDWPKLVEKLAKVGLTAMTARSTTLPANPPLTDSPSTESDGN